MLFFVLITLASAAAAAVQIVAGQSVDLALSMRWGMAIGLMFAGTDHLLKPRRYLPMMPDRVPYPRQVVFVTGLCEIFGALGLLLPMTRLAAGYSLAVYFVCVFPANIKNAVRGLSVDGLPSARWYYWLRLPFQPVAIWWALFAAGAIAWPRTSM